MRVLVLGVNHQIQPTTIRSMSHDGSFENFEREQKEAFGRFLEEIIRTREIQFVGEEASHREEMVASVVCERLACNYVNIEMPPKDRAARNLPGGYRDEDSQFSNEEKMRIDKEREDDMYARATRGAGDSKSILIICGTHHVTGLARRFGEAGHHTETTDLQQQDWYVEDWVKHCLGL